MPPPGQAQRAAQKFIVFEHFEKMNTQSVRQALSEKEMSWLENLQPIAPNNFVTVPAPVQPALVNISETIKSQFFFYSSSNGVTTDYIISFTTAGSGWATNIANGTTVTFAPPGTFSNPDMTTWNATFLLIVDPTAGYCMWDTSNFVKQGGVSPLITVTNGGSGYTSVPAVSITGGSGTGATAVATIGTPAVAFVSVVTGGSQYGPAPGVVFSGGGGTGAAATANIDPRGLTSITVTNAGTYLTGPTNVIFSGGGGGSGATATLHTDVDGFGRIVVVSISITTPGSNYSSVPTLTINGGSVLGANPATATCTVGNGAVLTITVTNGGSGYTSNPSVSFTGGGSGSGASAVAGVGGTSVTRVTLTNPGAGYLASDVLTVGFSGGGGTGAAASAHVWPFVGKGTTLAVFAGRVWIGALGNGLSIQYSGTGGFDDFSAANASGAFVISDNDLVHAVTALRNYNNYLFIMGDQSVKQIGNISVSGSATLFTVVTISSDQGTIYKQSCDSYNRVFMFMNQNGIYAVFGSSVQKISDDLDGIFKLIDFSQPPQAAIVDINGIHNIAWLVRYRDPLSSTRSIMLVFNGKKWFILSQGSSLMSIVSTSSLATGVTALYGSSGSDITRMVGDATVPVAFRIQTALTHHGNAIQRKKILSGGVAATLASGSGSLSVSYDTENGSVTKVYTLATGFTLPGGASGAEGSGRYLGATITGTLSGFTFNNTALEYQETSLWT